MERAKGNVIDTRRVWINGKAWRDKERNGWKENAEETEGESDD